MYEMEGPHPVLLHRLPIAQPTCFAEPIAGHAGHLRFRSPVSAGWPKSPSTRLSRFPSTRPLCLAMR
jgi:hypothetical protein